MESKQTKRNIENVAIIGKNGMLGKCLIKSLYQKHRIVDIQNIDITLYKELHDEISKISNLDCVINCAAVTDTNYCNTNEGMIESFNVNCIGVRNIARICNELKIHLIHISTDYVHSEYQSTINTEFPLNVYGCHKLLGEKYIQEEMQDKTQYSILRCSWLYGLTDRKKNFVDKIVDFCNNSKDGTIKVVRDCFGRPTSTEYVSKFIEKCIEKGQYGIIDSQIHNDTISRFDFAKMIVKNMNLDVDVIPVDSDFFPNLINQPKIMPREFTDESNKLQEITSEIEHSDDYEYWLKKYLVEKYGK